MSYFSLEFCVFAFVLFIIYFLFSKSKQWICLLIFSYLFYFLFSIKLSIFLLITTFSTYFSALLIEKKSACASDIIKNNKDVWGKEERKSFKASVDRKNRQIILITLLLNFGILTFFKFYGITAEIFNSISENTIMPKLNLILPLGISFYTFQAVGYLIDVYRGAVSAEKNLAKFALFLSFFPQILQGPISTYSQLAHQLYEPHKLNFRNFKYGSELILWGIFKKLVIADRAWIAISKFTEDVYFYNGATITFIVLLYSLQLYADFSAGIDISRGIAQILGIDMIDNFKRPYFAVSLGDYWRRWHISLGAWMKNYVFYPISLSKCAINVSKRLKNTRLGKTSFGSHISKVLPSAFASLVIFLIVGVWHGAGLKYVVYGIWNGAILMMSTILAPIYRDTNKMLHIREESFTFRLFRMTRTFLLAYIGYVIDLAPNMHGAIIMFRNMIFDQNFVVAYEQIKQMSLYKGEYMLLLICTFVLLVVGIIQEIHKDITIRQMMDRRPFVLRWIVIYIGIMSIVVLGTYGPGYDPADFVYMQF